MTSEVNMYYDLGKMETRCLKTAELRLDDTSSPKITGYAAVFDTWADIGGWFRESIRKGAFTRTIKEADVRALMNHNENYVLGRNKAGTLRLKEDSKGLAVEIDPAPTSWANDLLVSMKRGDVSQMSFGFTVNEQEVNYERDERVLTDVTLFDVSVVTYPAYPTTSAQVRSLFKAKEKKEDDLKWDEFDIISGKIKSGEVLTEEEVRKLMTYLPSVPPAKQTEPETPPAKQVIPVKRDKYMELLTKIEENKRSI